MVIENAASWLVAALNQQSQINNQQRSHKSEITNQQCDGPP